MTKNPQSELLPNAIRRRAPLRRGQELSVKRHCEGALRQVVGFFENMAEKDPTGKRFVYAGWEAALRGINKRYKMARRTFFDAQAVARSQHIISKPLQRVRGGKKYDGVIVTHPSALCVREGAWSVFTGRTPTPPIGRWREENGVTFWHGRGNPFGVSRTDAALGPHQLRTDAAPPPHQHRTDAALETSKSGTEIRTDVVSSKISEAVSVKSDVADGCTDCSVRKSLSETAPSQYSLQSIIRAKTLESVKSSETLKTFETSETVETGDQGQSNSNPENRKGVSSSLPRLTDQNLKPPPIVKVKGKTIGDYFAEGVTIELLTDYELDDEYLDEWLKKEDRELLLDCMQQAVVAKDAHPFCGRITNAGLMGDTMKLLRAHDADAPKAWYPVMKLLREVESTASSTATPYHAGVAEWAREIAARPRCVECGVRHLPPWCAPGRYDAVWTPEEKRARNARIAASRKQG